MVGRQAFPFGARPIFRGELLNFLGVSKKKIWGASSWPVLTWHFRFLLLLWTFKKTGKGGNPQQVDNKLISVDFPLRCSYNRPLKYQSIKTVATNSMENLDPPEEVYQAQTKPSPRNQKKASNHGLQEHHVTPATSKTNSEKHPAKWCSMLIFSGNLFQHAKISRWKEHNVYMFAPQAKECSTAKKFLWTWRIYACVYHANIIWCIHICQTPVNNTTLSRHTYKHICHIYHIYIYHIYVYHT